MKIFSLTIPKEDYLNRLLRRTKYTKTTSEEIANFILKKMKKDLKQRLIFIQENNLSINNTTC